MWISAARQMLSTGRPSGLRPEFGAGPQGKPRVPVEIQAGLRCEPAAPGVQGELAAGAEQKLPHNGPTSTHSHGGLPPARPPPPPHRGQAA